MKTRHVVYRVAFNKGPNPWDDRAAELFEKYEPQSILERMLYRGHAASEWRVRQHGNGAAKAWHNFWNDKLLAAGYQGTLYKEGSQNLEALTGKPAEWCAEKNAAWWTPISLVTEHASTVLAVFGAEKATLGRGELAIIPLAYAGVFLSYNVYRYHQAKRGKVFPNIGYVAIGTNAREILHQNSTTLYKDITWRAKQEGTSTWYAYVKTVFDNVTRSFLPSKAKHA
ncbi:hypothetical protein GF367_01745 [Candidatus Woesearchaeota archaeon]|nr:hypothetical protein [Candidatus Woesearchaeota archaeon]